MSELTDMVEVFIAQGIGFERNNIIAEGFEHIELVLRPGWQNVYGSGCVVFSFNLYGDFQKVWLDGAK